MSFTQNVREPWFTLIASGIKTVEGRLQRGYYLDIKRGTIIVWSNNQLGFTRTHKSVVKSTKLYPSFELYLRGEGLENCLPAPGVTSIATGVTLYRMHYDNISEIEFGVIAVRL